MRPDPRLKLMAHIGTMLGRLQESRRLGVTDEEIRRQLAPVIGDPATAELLHLAMKGNLDDVDITQLPALAEYVMGAR